MLIETVNVGTDLEPRWRLTVDGVIVARVDRRDCETGGALAEELREDEEKARAIRDAFLKG